MSAVRQSLLGSASRLYQIWAGIKTRCYNPKSQNYRNYGARGIKMCDEWQSYPKFEAWALSNGYNPNASKKAQSIERIDVNGIYSPGNCTWANAKQQMNNTRRNTFITYSGRTQTLKQWAEEFGISYSTFMSRYLRGWSMERIKSSPVRTYKGESDVNFS